MKNLFLIFFSIYAFTINAQDTKLTYFLSGEVGLTNILISEHPLFDKEELGSAAKLSGAVRSGLRYRCAKKLGLNSGLEFGLTRYGEDNSRRLSFGPGNGQTVTTAEVSSIRSFNIGVPVFLDIKLGSKVSLLMGAKYQYNFSGKMKGKIVTPTGPSEQELDFSITKSNVSGMIGFRYYPKRTDGIRKNMFLGLSAEYFLIADRIFFAFNDANRFSVNLT